MELRVLEYFLAVAREESITGAANALHLSQPTLSRQLKDLEDELGKQLMIRGNRKIELTEEGMLLQKRAEEILSLVKKTEADIVASDNYISGDIYIGAGETDGVRYLIDAAMSTRRKHPDIHFHISSGDQADVYRDLDNGLIDFGFVFGDFNKSKYNSIAVPYSNEWGILMRKDDALAHKKHIFPKDILKKPLIVSRVILDEKAFNEFLGLSFDQTNIVATYNLLYNASLMVEAGMGYAICLGGIINTSGDSPLTFIPFKESQLQTLHVIWKKYQIFSKASNVYLEELMKF